MSSFSVAAGNTAYIAVGGVLFTSDGTTLVVYPPKAAAATYTVPSTVTSIGVSAFYGNSIITALTVPASVTQLGRFAFGYMPNLKKVTFLGNAPMVDTSDVIYEDEFQYLLFGYGYHPIVFAYGTGFTGAVWRGAALIANPNNPTWWLEVAADAYGGGNGTQDSPYLIGTPQQLAKFELDSITGDNGDGKYYKLTADVNLSQYKWIPLGSKVDNIYSCYWEYINNNQKFGFAGTLDGNGRKISGVKIHEEYTGLLGFFGT